MKNSFLVIARKITTIVVAFVFIFSSFPVNRANAEASPVPVCTPDPAQVFMSSTSTQVDGEDSVAITTPNPAWALIAGADASSTPVWIWSEDLDASSSSPIETKTFTQNFTIASTSDALDSSLEIAADNTYSVTVNGIALDTGDSATTTTNYNPTQTWTIPAGDLVVGNNTIAFTVSNTVPPADYTGPNPAGLIYKLTVNSETCVIPPPDVTVTIVKYIDGARATAETASSTSFDMTATWAADNIGSGTAHYPLSPDGYNGDPTPYQAITSEMTSGANYSTSENDVPTVCSADTQFALQGYKIGDTEEAAQSAATTTDATLTDITSNKYILVLNQNCNLVGPSLPVHVSPADGSSHRTADQTLIDWTDSTSIHPGVTYTYQVANDNATSSDGSLTDAIYTSDPLTDSSIPTPNTPEGTYFWHVEATDSLGNVSGWTTPWKVIVDNTAPSLPIHLSPASGTVITTANQTLIDWTDATDTSPVYYLYESSLDPATSTDGSFVDPVYGPATTTDSSIPTPSTPEGTYYWHVEAVDAAGNVSGWTAPWTIIVDDTPPTTPVHISPSNNSTLTSAEWTSADWTDATDTSGFPVTYLYESANNSATTSSGRFAFPIYNSAPLTDSQIPTTGTPEGTWYWHVQAVDAAGNTSPWTDPWKVVVSNATSTDDGDSTSTPPLLTIVKNTVGGDGTFNFSIFGDTSTSTQVTTIDGSGTSSDIVMNEGTSTVDEDITPGWNLNDVSCVYDNNSIGISVIGGEEVHVQNGDHVTCTFDNATATSSESTASTTGSIEIVKKVLDSNGTTTVDNHVFQVTLNGTSTQDVAEGLDAFYNDLSPGTYTIGENANADYDLLSISPDVNPESIGAQVNVEAGTTTVVTIINEQHATSTPPDSGNGNGGGFVGNTNPNIETGGGSTSPSSGSGTGTTTGSVLGASTDGAGPSCNSNELLTAYMRLGGNNNPKEVIKLQTFLNSQDLGITVPVTGFFGPLTDKAVRLFQMKYAEQILGPWVSAGLYPNTSVPTGYVYKTTLRWINLLICQNLNTPIPQLP